jgi:nitrate reductase gamma subunit
MWPAFLIGLLSEFFNESKEISKFVLKGFASGIAGMILNFALLLLISNQASTLVGYETPALTNITVNFVLVPVLAAFVALIIVKSARYFSNMGATATDRP